MKILYISPHFDDAVFSCGGLIWQQIQEGHQVSIWTMFSGDPPQENLSDFAEELHLKWQGENNENPKRREEDILSCNILGVLYHHLDLLDCIYRMDSLPSLHFYPSEEAIFGNIHDLEKDNIEVWAKMVSKMIPQDAVLVSPIGIGNHVDHQITRNIVEKLSQPIQYYLDYPYVVNEEIEVDTYIPGGYYQKVFPISKIGKEKWQRSIEAHQSQLTSFWSGIDDMREKIEDFVNDVGGVKLVIKK